MASCAKTITAGGTAFHNEAGESDPEADLKRAFAMSCNTAFIHAGYQMHPGDLADEARNVFGIGTNWSIGGGVFVQDGSVPAVPPNNATQAADLIGQGKDLMNPLAVASVAATIAGGQNAESTNGWFVAPNQSDHLAVGVLVIGGKTGAESAGYLARALLLGL